VRVSFLAGRAWCTDKRQRQRLHRRCVGGTLPYLSPNRRKTLEQAVINSEQGRAAGRTHTHKEEEERDVQAGTGDRESAAGQMIRHRRE
jgi:hypothetical protein